MKHHRGTPQIEPTGFRLPRARNTRVTRVDVYNPALPVDVSVSSPFFFLLLNNFDMYIKSDRPNSQETNLPILNPLYRMYTNIQLVY